MTYHYSQQPYNIVGNFFDNGLHKEVIYVKLLYSTLDQHSIIQYSADIAKFRIIQIDGKTGVAINFCDEYGNITDSPRYDTNNYCNVRILYIYSNSIYTNQKRKRKNTFGRDDDYKR